MKVKIVCLVLVLFFASNCYSVQPVLQVAQTSTTAPPITTPQNIKFEDCINMFPVNKEELFYQTLAAISANKFSIEEIQTANGYVIFSVTNRRYLATVAEINSNNSALKITPCNNTYFFPPGIYLNMFKYINMNIK